MINSFKNPAIMRILRTTERHGAGWREQNFIPDHEGLFGSFTDKGIPKPPDRPHGKRLMGPCCRAADARRVGKDEGTSTV